MPSAGRWNEAAGIGFEIQVTVPVIYQGIVIPLDVRADIIVENTIILEIEAAAAFLLARDARRLTYLRMSISVLA